MTKLDIRIVLLLALAGFAFVCGHGYPRIHNMMGVPVILEAQYANGQSIHFELLPDERLHAPRDSGAFTEIFVRVNGEILFQLERAELERLISGFPEDARVIWELHEGGIRPTVFEG